MLYKRSRAATDKTIHSYITFTSKKSEKYIKIGNYKNNDNNSNNSDIDNNKTIFSLRRRQVLSSFILHSIYII